LFLTVVFSPSVLYRLGQKRKINKTRTRSGTTTRTTTIIIIPIIIIIVIVINTCANVFNLILNVYYIHGVSV